MKSKLQVWRPYERLGHSVRWYKFEGDKIYVAKMIVESWEEVLERGYAPVSFHVGEVEIQGDIEPTSLSGENKILKEEIKYLREQISKLLERV